ncbi:BRO1-like domain-containing protein [Dipodascopsis uninucleata]
MSMSNILAVPLKRTDDFALETAIKNYIEHSYDQHPDMYNGDIKELDRLRHSVFDCQITTSSLEDLYKYFIQLTFCSSKFPSNINAKFVWYSTLGYSTSAAVIHEDLQYERANILYNIAALHSNLGRDENRSSGEGLKRASQAFQTAAGCFQYLKNNVISEMKLNPPEDMTSATLDVLIQLMLAQAQECFWQKAVLDQLKNSIIARLANQVSQFYGQALDFSMKSAIIRSDWIHHLTCKKYHFEAAAHYRISMDCLSSGKYGEEIARLQIAQELCSKAVASAKYVSNTVASDMKGLAMRLKSDYGRAEKDNDLIYLATVPPVYSLAPIKAASTVSSVAPAEIEKSMDLITTDKYGPPLFVNLVPFAAHQAASIYDSRRDMIVEKTIISKLEALTVGLHDFLTALGLPGSLQALERPVGLPPSLITHIEEIRAKGGIVAVQSSIEDLRNLASIDSAIYVTAADILNEERKEDDVLRERYGTNSWKRPNSKEAGVELYSQLQTYGNLIKTAADNDELIRSKFRDNQNALNLLSQDLSLIEQYLPNSEAVRLNPELERRSSTVREKLNEISRIEHRRRKFCEDLRAKTREDNISELILQETARLSRLDPLAKIEPSQFETLFTERLKIYNEDKATVEQEEEEQSRVSADLELATKDFNDALAEFRGRVPAERETALQELEAGYFKYLEIQSNLEEGRKFYNDLSKPLTQFQDECNDFVYSRRVESREIEEDLLYQFERLNLGHEQGPRCETPLPAPRAQGPPPPVLNTLWNPDHGIQFGDRSRRTNTKSNSDRS